MKLIIVGGHLSPALAVIDALPKDTKILFIGRKYVFERDKTLSLEFRTITKQKIPFASIYAGRWQRIFTKHTIPSFFKFPYGILQSFFILRKFKPDVVLSFGGYLSLPVGLSAYILGIPLVIHEQTLEAGVASRILSIFAKKICISWESSRKFFPPSKVVLTGNPIRDFQLSLRGAQRRNNPQQQEIATLPFDKLRVARNDIPTIYITGGSAGSHFINTLVEGSIKELLKKFIVIHQTGDAQEFHDFDRLQRLKESLYSELKARYQLIKFVQPQDVGSVLQKADLVIGRSGINTVTELIFFKKPALLIPIPVSQKNEQKKNALFLKGLGLAEVLNQESLDSKKLLRFIEEMFNNKSRYQLKERFWIFDQNYGRDAAQKIIEVLKYAKKNNKEP